MTEKTIRIYTSLYGPLYQRAEYAIGDHVALSSQETGRVRWVTLSDGKLTYIVDIDYYPGLVAPNDIKKVPARNVLERI